jgi:hypothetical protein
MKICVKILGDEGNLGGILQACMMNMLLNMMAAVQVLKAIESEAGNRPLSYIKM